MELCLNVGSSFLCIDIWVWIQTCTSWSPLSINSSSGFNLKSIQKKEEFQSSTILRCLGPLNLQAWAWRGGPVTHIAQYELDLKLTSLAGQAKRIWTLTCVSNGGALKKPFFGWIFKFKPELQCVATPWAIILSSSITNAKKTINNNLMLCCSSPLQGNSSWQT